MPRFNSGTQWNWKMLRSSRSSNTSSDLFHSFHFQKQEGLSVEGRGSVPKWTSLNRSIQWSHGDPSTHCGQIDTTENIAFPQTTYVQEVTSHLSALRNTNQWMCWTKIIYSIDGNVSLNDCHGRTWWYFEKTVFKKNVIIKCHGKKLRSRYCKYIFPEQKYHDTHSRILNDWDQHMK